jgi:hypothetical protein
VPAVFGDAEAAVVAVLCADPGVIASAARVSTDLIGYAAPARWVRVTRTGGSPTLWMHVDNPLISLAAYAEDKAAALDLAGTARAAVFAARGRYTGHGLALFDVADDAGLEWKPDDADPTIARYVWALSLVTRPA